MVARPMSGMGRKNSCRSRVALSPLMAIDGVVGGLQIADAPLLAGSVGAIRRAGPDHTVEIRVARVAASDC